MLFILYLSYFLPLVSVSDGSLTTWSSWSQCSKSCGGGLRLASRNCSNPTFDGADCTKLGELTKIEICNNVSCPGMFLFRGQQIV